jgi:hypothetical protein
LSEVEGLPEIARRVLVDGFASSFFVHWNPSWRFSALGVCGAGGRPAAGNDGNFFPVGPRWRSDPREHGWLDPRLRLDEPRVPLTALRKAYTESRLHQIRADTRSQPASLTVRTIIPAASDLFADRSGTIDYTVTVPETAQLKLKLVNGDVTLHGLRGGRANIELVNGRIIALNCYARVQARSVNGALEVFYEWWENLRAAFDYTLQHGRIDASLPSEARFAVDAATSNGWIHDGFKFNSPTNVGPGQCLKTASARDALVSLGLRTGGGNISLNVVR